MGRRGFDSRNNKHVMDLLVPSHLVLVQPGESKRINLHYGGHENFEVIATAKCGRYKCRHCPAAFSGDARRASRHFLPTGLPKSFSVACFRCLKQSIDHEFGEFRLPLARSLSEQCAMVLEPGFGVLKLFLERIFTVFKCVKTSILALSWQTLLWT